jgi:integrase
MGVSKRGNKWRAFISVKKKDGSYKSKALGTFTTKTEAMSAVRNAQILIDKNKQISGAIPFYDYFDWYVEKYKKASSSKKTLGHYQDSKRYIKKYLGDLSLCEITNDIYVDLITRFSKDYAPETLEKYHAHMRSCIKKAFSLGHISIEVTSGVSLRGLGDKSKEKPINQKYIDDVGYKQVVKYVIENKSIESSIYYVILFALLTGCRFSEIVGITISDIDFLNGFVDINKTYDYIDPPINSDDWLPCKTKNSYRKIELPENLLKLISEFWTYQQEQCKERGIVNARKQVFFDWQDGVCSNRKANIEIKKILIACGIRDKPKFSLHCCRHTFISFLIYQGYSIEEVSVIAGDNPEQISKTYYHVFMEYKARTQDKTKKLTNSLF